MMTKEQMIEKLESHPVIKQFMEIITKENEVKKYNYVEAHLVGGAVIDILDDREPKDYDFIQSGFGQFVNSNEDFIFVHETKTAKTYNFKGKVVQLLKVPPAQFEFKISQAEFVIQNGKIEGVYEKKPKINEIKIDKISFDQRQLIPTSFDNIRVVRDCLMRIPHWMVKGYNIRNETYLSLVRAAFNLKSNKS